VRETTELFLRYAADEIANSCTYLAAAGIANSCIYFGCTYAAIF
jgi:hypothetical protein